MVKKTSPDLEAVARRAFERGRVKYAARQLAYPIFVTVAAVLLLRAPLAVAVPVGVLLTAIYGFTQFRGTSLARGARRGLLLGMLPFSVPWLVRASGSCMIGGSCATTCMSACVLAGATTGIAVSLAATRDAAPRTFGIGAGLMLLISAGIGCAAIGIGEFVGVGLGLAIAGLAHVCRMRVA
ncbi:MAG: hypothetical protein HOW73_26850 [Polyangiaceae bacterium]|nr:hypothetical protein [Polyangiaceae bacterium]